jgi:four helix bundle protein
MNQVEMKARTKQFALRAMKLVRALPKDVTGKTIGSQLLRSASSVAANYRAACRARSKAEFIAKIGTVLEEADESELWLELIVEDGVLPKTKCEPLLQEADELVSIFVATRKSALDRTSGLKSEI